MATREERIISVSQLNAVAKMILENEPLLTGITVRGELSGVKKYASGHIYFTLKDRDAAVSCVMFAGNAYSLKFLPTDGMTVRVRGTATVYERDGRFQFSVRSMEAEGKGGLWEAYERLKEKLKSEGLFSEEHKKPLPRFPHRIGVVTSREGAVFQDILNVTGRRYPMAEILLYPSAVQGAEAAAQLAKGVKTLDETGNCDVIIIGRGGGSMEDLWCFNDERLARAVFSSETPIISAVGHETDFTICDFVADRRAPTPSAAAEMAVPDREELKKALALVKARMQGCLEEAIEQKKRQIDRLKERKVLSDPSASLSVKKQRISDFGERLDYAAVGGLMQKRANLKQLQLCFDPSVKRHAEKKREKVASLAGRLAGLNPMSVLSRGYSAVFAEDGRVLKTVASLEIGQNVTLKMSDGAAGMTVNRIEKNG